MLKIKEKIYEIREKQVMLISDLAKLYNMETKRINELIKRNKELFNAENYFKLDNNEWDSLRSQIATSSYGGNRYLPYVITLEGIEKLEIILKSEEVKNINIKIKNEFKNEIIESNEITDLIYEIMGKQVMLDYDLAELYKVETKRINEAVKNNPLKFPEKFCFQLTNEEIEILKFSRSKFSTLNKNGDKRGYNIKYMPYAFTEQGVWMLSTILSSDVAIETSIKIVDAFVQMRRFLNNNMYLFKEIGDLKTLTINNTNRISNLEESLLNLQTKENNNYLFFEGQIYDAYSVLVDILKEAEEEIIIIDNYLDKNILDVIKLFDKKTIVVTNKYNYIDVEKYCKQYENLEIRINNSFHDRFIIMDKKILYSSGSSLKDIGKKCFAINKIEDEDIINKMLQKLNCD